MKTEITRAGTPAEYAAIAALAAEIWHETYDALLPDGQVDYMLDRFQSEKAIARQTSTEGYAYFNILCDGALGGFLALVPHCEKQGELYVSKVYLHKNFRGQGAMRVAFAFIDEFCRESGCGTMRLTVNKQNAHAKAVYVHFGYAVARLVVSDIGGGYVMDDFVMEKVL
ncbi:MAG: GNAT family N-acetyltransferase [Oscillospiraceae bacterium]|jgi:GNAT superfamily N-acetyltransferase|nr:GNAT family N-acetyltransferase [Oscillospiraceae bacterium]